VSESRAGPPTTKEALGGLVHGRHTPSTVAVQWRRYCPAGHGDSSHSTHTPDRSVRPAGHGAPLPHVNWSVTLAVEQHSDATPITHTPLASALVGVSHDEEHVAFLLEVKFLTTLS